MDLQIAWGLNAWRLHMVNVVSRLMLLVFEGDLRLVNVIISFRTQALPAILTDCIIQDLLQGLLNLLFKLDWVIFEVEFVKTFSCAELRDCSATAWLPNLLRNFQYLGFTTIDYQSLPIVELLSTVLGIKSVN